MMSACLLLWCPSVLLPPGYNTVPDNVACAFRLPAAPPSTGFCSLPFAGLLAQNVCLTLRTPRFGVTVEFVCSPLTYMPCRDTGAAAVAALPFSCCADTRVARLGVPHLMTNDKTYA
jgi:hypothetical protein